MLSPYLSLTAHPLRIPPPTVTIDQLSATDVHLSWSYPSEIQSPFYFVYYFPVGGSENHIAHVFGTSKTIRNEFVDDTYIVTVIAFWGSYGVADPVKITMCRVQQFICIVCSCK